MLKKQYRLMSLLVSFALMATMCNSFAIAKKAPALSKKKVSITVGKTTKIKIKNGAAGAKVKWSVSKKNVAKIISSKKSGKAAFATIKGVKKGSCKLNAKYTAGNIKKTLSATIIVNPKGGTATMAPVATSTAIVQETAVPTQTPDPTPEPTPTPIPFENLVEVKELPNQVAPPDMFTYIDGTEVTAENWEGRAEEIRQMYQYYMYGMWRNGDGEYLSYDISGNDLKIDIETDGSQDGQVAGGNASFTVDVHVPDGTAPENGWPVIICMGKLSEQDYALTHGYAVINYDTAQVSTDSAARQGAFYTLYPYNMNEWREQTGVLMAWAWGASKILDALFDGAGSDYGIDPEFAIIGGVSRWGKATAVTGAFDQRFKIALPTCSGCGGMGVFRFNPNAQVTQTYDVSSLGYMSTVTYKSGDVETLGSIQSSGEAFWFNQRFLQFRDIYHLPFDQYFLSSLYAKEGRSLMLIGGFNYDVWQNTPNLWYNFQKAKPVFDMLDLSENIIINLHDHSMGHNILNVDIVNMIKYIDEKYRGVDVANFEISDLQTTLFELTDTPSGINNKEVYESVKPD